MITGWIAIAAWANLHSGRTGGVYQWIDALPIVVAVVGLAFLVLTPLGIASVARASGLRRTAAAYMVLSGLVFAGVVIQMTVSRSEQ